MEAIEIFEFLSNLPWWFWVIFVFTMMVLGSDRSIWEYEVKFLFQEGVGKGEIEFENKKKKGMYVECDFDLEEQYHNKALEIFLAGKNVICVPAEENMGGYIRFEKPVSIEEPSVGDSVVVKIDNIEIFTGILKLD